MKIKKVHWLFCIQNKWFTCNTDAQMKNCALVAEVGQPFVDKWCAENPLQQGESLHLELPSTSWSYSAQKLIFELDYEKELCV